jgi:hypothetical protein
MLRVPWQLRLVHIVAHELAVGPLGVVPVAEQLIGLLRPFLVDDQKRSVAEHYPGRSIARLYDNALASGNDVVAPPVLRGA